MQAAMRLILTLAILVGSALHAQEPGDVRPRPLGWAIDAASRGDWTTAERIAARDGDVARDVITWMRLRAGLGTLDEVETFIARRGDWPGLALMQRRVEPDVIAAGEATVLAYFASVPPQTARGVLAHAQALGADGQTGEAEANVVLAWRTMDMDSAVQDAFLEVYADILAPHHWARADMLLWDRDREGASRMRPLLTEGQQAVMDARLALQRRSEGVNALIAAVPANLASDSGLARDRMEWRVRAGLWTEAKDMMLASSANLGVPEGWASRRRALARDEMRDGDAARAYRLASEHGLEGGSAYADLEWLSGFIALRLLGDPETAVQHFRNHRAVIASPISRGRAGYWIGRALEAAGDETGAKASYADGAQFQTSFYGLLAAERAGLPFDAALAGPETPPDWQASALTASPLFEAGLLLQASGQLNLAERFWTHLAEQLLEEDAALLGQAAIDAGQPHLAVMIGKRVARRGITIPAPYYPLHPLAAAELPMDPAMSLAIARRESEFDPGVQSGVGARGLMQIMPATGRDVARDLGLSAEHSTDRLTADPVYNARLGATYLSQMAGRFDGNVVLMSVAYNAGPARPPRWIELYGDPRGAEVDIVDWIEFIPFRETRNYVMRVTESLPVYRARLGRDPLPVPFTQELKGNSLLAFAPKGE
ncbi:MAG: lytic transglycosylase domain-containing protein [Pseudomonadota bacterium]